MNASFLRKHIVSPWPLIGTCVKDSLSKTLAKAALDPDRRLVEFDWRHEGEKYRVVKAGPLWTDLNMRFDVDATLPKQTLLTSDRSPP